MNTVQDYKCPNCSAPLVFNANNQKLHCESCDSNFSIEDLKAAGNQQTQESFESKYDWKNYHPRDFKSDGKINLSAYSCPSCGAQIVGDENLGTTVCPYCGNSTIIKEQFEGTLMPDFLIPFKVDKKTAMKAFEKASLKAPFLPKEFKDKKKIEEMSGLYVPYWIFGCDCHANVHYNATKVSHWSDSDYDYTKTDYYQIIRSGTVGFENIPVDGSSKIDNIYTESVEPYNYNDAVNFDTAYLSGYLADRYDVDSEDCVDRANERVKNSTEDIFRSTVIGYDTVSTIGSSVNFSDGEIRYSLLPMWMLNIKYNDNTYKYAINGQTEKVVGEFPVCKKRRNTFFAIVYVITLAVCFLIAKLLGFI
ncbi:MAG: hypothetical protein Q4B14_04660 [Clostridia bacterium]|nr:hypothetical protein [Clostridia bacterium]